MIKKQIYLIVTVLGASLLISGCQQTPEKAMSESSVPISELNAGEVRLPDSAIRFNAEITLPANNEMGQKKAKIVKVYDSALGQQCLLVRDEQIQESVWCERVKGIYKLYPALLN